MMASKDWKEYNWSVQRWTLTTGPLINADHPAALRIT
jgi:hypothetical protein